MIDPAKLAAFALVTGLVSLTPGPPGAGPAPVWRRSPDCSSAMRRGS